MALRFEPCLLLTPCGFVFFIVASFPGSPHHVRFLTSIMHSIIHYCISVSPHTTLLSLSHYSLPRVSLSFYLSLSRNVDVLIA